MSNPNPIPQTPTPIPQTATKKPIILISTIAGLVLLSIIAGVVVYQSKMTETNMASKSSSSVMSQMGMNQSNMANSMGSMMSMGSMSMAENKSAMATGNLSKFTDPELPGFGLSHDSSWKHEVTKFEAGNGSGGPAGDFYAKSVQLTKGNAILALNVNTIGPSGIGLPSCFKKTNTIVKGSKYTIIQDINGTQVELSSNLIASSEAEFKKYFTASNSSAPIEEFAYCVKSSKVLSETPINFKDSKGKVFTSGIVFVQISGGSQAEPVKLSEMQLKEIVTILDTITGVSQINV
ncbi:MAG: hypothetical protein H7230_01865 [Candidatus Parcubacteria bacterium]|nr:hypothetical protein [Candidatus Paceibacterota bacterium]